MTWTRRAVASTLALGVVLAVTAAGAGPATEAVRAAVDRVVQIVQDPELAKPASVDVRRARVREVARQLFDFEEMTKRALGRHWTSRTPEERRHFVELFTDLLENAYVGRIEGYGGEKIAYLAEQPTGNAVTVRSSLTTDAGTAIPIDYRMQKEDDRWRVYDVVIEGVSLVSNYRTQFNRIITQSSYEELVKRLEQKRLEVAEEQRTRGPASRTR